MQQLDRFRACFPQALQIRQDLLTTADDPPAQSAKNRPRIDGRRDSRLSITRSETRRVTQGYPQAKGDEALYHESPEVVHVKCADRTCWQFSVRLQGQRTAAEPAAPGNILP